MPPAGANFIALSNRLTATCSRRFARAGDVFAPAHGYLAARAGKASTMHDMAFLDLRRAGQVEACDRLIDELSEAIAARRFGAILTDRDWREDWPQAGIEQHYRARHELLDDLVATQPLTGAPVRARYLYVPQTGATGGNGARSTPAPVRPE